MSPERQRTSGGKVQLSQRKSGGGTGLDTIHSQSELWGFKRIIFVFGSNREGRHGKGAALIAVQKHGAIRGQPSDLQGNSYGIITKELRPGYPPVTKAEILSGVRRFKRFAARHSDWLFNVTPIGCGLAGFDPADIAPMFSNASSNVILPPSFVAVLHGS